MVFWPTGWPSNPARDCTFTSEGCLRGVGGSWIKTTLRGGFARGATFRVCREIQKPNFFTLVWTFGVFFLEVKGKRKLAGILTPSCPAMAGCMQWRGGRNPSKKCKFKCTITLYSFKCHRRARNKQSTTVTQQAWRQCYVGGDNAGHYQNINSVIRVIKSFISTMRIL